MPNSVDKKGRSHHYLMSLGHVRFRGRVSETAIGEDERDDDEFDEQEQRAALAPLVERARGWPPAK